MQLFTAGLVLCVVFAVLSALVAVAYIVLNKKVQPKAPLLSSAQVQDLMDRYNDAASLPVQYSNVFDYSLQHTSHVMNPRVPSNTLNIYGCNNYCNGTRGCQGFQFNSSTNTCELLSNVGNTFYTYDQGWNLFVTGTVADNALGSQISSQGFSTDPSKKKGPISDATTYDACVPYCFSNATSCTGFSISSSGCTLFAETSVQVPDSTSNSWKVVPVTHGNGLSPAPAPSPS
jgi:PAN domain